MPRVVHFEIHADNMERAAKFYTDLFGWEFIKWEGEWEYYLIGTGDDNQPGINGGLMKRISPNDGESVIAYVCTVDVENLDKYLEKGIRLGASVAIPKMTVPGVGWMAYLKDTEGNIFGMMQMDESVK